MSIKYYNCRIVYILHVRIYIYIFRIFRKIKTGINALKINLNTINYKYTS